MQCCKACLSHAVGIQCTPSLAWHSLPADPDCPGITPRARHATLFLDGLQHQDWTDLGGVPGLCGSMVVFGGVLGDVWLTDLQVLTILETTSGHIKLIHSTVHIIPPSIVHSQALSTDDTSSQPVGELGARRDFAACACGQNQFVVVGGYDGKCEIMDMCMFTLTLCHTNDSPGQYVAAHSCTVNNSTAVASTTSSLRVQACCHKVTARNRLLPAARSHHSLCYHADGKSLVLFGGYSSSVGCLNCVWLYHMEHMEWWQPDTTGKHEGVMSAEHAVM